MKRSGRSLGANSANVAMPTSANVTMPSSGIATVDFGRQTAIVPVGLSMGKVMQLSDGNLLKPYLEPQYSVVQSGLGQPGFQIFAGFKIQFPPARRP